MPKNRSFIYYFCCKIIFVIDTACFLCYLNYVVLIYQYNNIEKREAFRMRNRLKKGASFVMAAVLILGMSAPAASAATAQTNPTPAGTEEAERGKLLPSYTDYIKEHENVPQAAESITLNSTEAAVKNGAAHVSNFKNTGYSCVTIPDTGSASWDFDIAIEGRYQMIVTYMPAEQSSGDVEQSLTIDGKTPFREVALVGFRRTYQQAAEFQTNVAGNDIKPSVTEVFGWKDYALQDASGYVSSPFLFTFKEGRHTLAFAGSRGNLAIAKIALAPYAGAESYQEYSNRHSQHSNAEIASPLIVEGEKLTYKTSLTVLPSADRASSVTYPQSATALKLNTLGGENWKRVGESVTWKFTVDKDGLYEITPRFRQSTRDGIFTSRKLLIDGNLPFAEAASLHFEYSSDWQMKALGNGSQTYRFYLPKGEHTLTLEVVLGDVAEMIGRIERSLNDLNRIYRRIIMITGPSPDVYRDYNFDELIPEEIKELGEQRKQLLAAVDALDKAAGDNGSYTSIIKKIIFQLDKMSTKPESIAKYLSQFKSNIGSLGTWLLTATEQPLQIDRFYIAPSGMDLPKAEAGLFSQIGFNIRCFFATFVTDYSSIGQTVQSGTAKSLKVWIQTGRDQAEILRQLIDSGFAEKHQTAVTLELVAGGTLLQSVLAGMAPDIALNNAVGEPINYAIRNANMNLTQFSDYQEVAKRFHPSALIPYTYHEKVYALPETFTFPMFFYRTDIFEEAGLSLPKTWNELITLIPVLQRKNLTMGIPHDINFYATLLYQNGGELYEGEGIRTKLNTNVGLNTFIELTELFTLYNLPVTYDFANRFRSGEMPCGIADYTLYNQLTVFAPEIKGFWNMVPVPGKIDKNGKINNVAVGSGTNAMIINDCKDPKLAWEFLKWWMSADIQSTFAVNMESILGPAGKYATANMEALTKMTWSSKEYTNLLNQLNHVSAVPEVPGGYYLSRVLNFAFSRVYNGSGEQSMAENPVEVIGEYIDELNDELKRKREEFSVR